MTNKWQVTFPPPKTRNMAKGPKYFQLKLYKNGREHTIKKELPADTVGHEFNLSSEYSYIYDKGVEDYWFEPSVVYKYREKTQVIYLVPMRVDDENTA